LKKTVSNPVGIAKPLSNYSHVVRVEIADTALLFVAGQIAFDQEGKLVGDDISTQTEFIFRQIESILKGEGAALTDVVKATIYVTDMSFYNEVAVIRNRYFALESAPATTFVEVSALAREGLLVEIEVQAAVQLST